MATYVLVPGAGGDAGYWYRVTPLLTAAGHDVVAVQLPNHDGVGLGDHADAIVAATGDRDEVVLVAQSMGGFAAPLACDRLPVRQLVFVNAMIPAPGETPGEWWGNTGQGEAARDRRIADGRDPDSDFDPVVDFFNGVPQDVVEFVFSQPVADPAGSIFGSALSLSALPEVPTKVITAQDDRLFPAPFQRRVAMDRLGIVPDVVPGSHLVAFSNPEGLVAQLLSYEGNRTR